MAIVIEQEPDKVSLSSHLQLRSEIVGIRLRHLEVTLNGEFKPDLEMNILFNPEDTSLEAGRLTVSVRFKLGMKEHAAQSPLFEVDCVYQTAYTVDDPSTITKEHIVAFSEANAIFNLWPYFRQVSQDSMIRCGIPPRVIPFLRMAPKRQTPVSPQVADKTPRQEKGQMQVDKQEFDTLLGKLLKSEPLPKAAIAPKTVSLLKALKRKAAKPQPKP